MPNVHSFTVLPALPKQLKDLDFIARNIFWAWNLEFVAIFKRIDPKLWMTCQHNPVKLLGSVSQERLEALAKNQSFLSELRRAAEKLRAYLDAPTWFDKVAPEGAEPVIAYFSAEFGIHESIPIYSGGLGVLAGDHLKSASDLGVPLVGVGLLYQKGYFSQYLNVDGWQQEVYVENDFYNIPVELLKAEDGRPITISVDYPDGPVSAQIWSISVGRVKLYLLDANIPANSSRSRMITANLYGGDLEMRIRQEILLGIGGLRALTAIGISPTVCHMNEGHAAFMALERIRQMLDSKEMTFAEALEATKTGNIFTVHTPVAAGNDQFPPDMMNKYFAGYYLGLGLDEEQFFALGRINPADKNEPFKMPVLAMKLSSYRNGVSSLHGKVSRNMWSGLWPSVPIDEVPIDSVTNGVHIKSWLSEEMNLLYERYLGPTWANESADKSIWENIDQIPDEELWRTHQRCKESLVTFARKKLKAQMQRRGTFHTELNWAEEVLDPEALTIGFARRFATYKRGNLLLRDPQRFVKLLTDPKRPVQIVFAGKAHPRDTEGKEIIRQIIHFATKYNVRRRIVFIENYNINVARYLVRGVDIWLNTPRPPMEASGTSGMKAGCNGALNISTWDGWWCEGYDPQLGWVIGSGEKYDDPNHQDMVESKAIYNILENEVIPLFYDRTADNLPRSWIQRMKAAIKSITPRFNTDRMVAEYAENFYIPAIKKWRYFTAESMSRAKELSAWKSNIRAAWQEFQIRDVKVNLSGRNGDNPLTTPQPQLKVGSKLDVSALVRLNSVEPDNIAVELYYGPVDSWGNISQGQTARMDYRKKSDNGNDGEHWFNGLMTCKISGRQGFIVRVLPRHDDLTSPYELGLILWESASSKN